MPPGRVLRFTVLPSLIVATLAFGPRALASPSCAELAAAPVVVAGAPAGSDDASGWARAIWDSVVAVGLDTAGTPPRLALTAPSALEAGAWYCRADDVVYLSHALVSYAWLGRASDGADLLAFAMAHELAHRRFDAGAPPTATLADDACPAADSALEARADRRATFLMAIATNPRGGRGYSPFSLARRDALASFFTAELGWSPTCPALVLRLASVRAALDAIADRARLWDVAQALVHADPEAAVSYLDALAGAADSSWDAMPELDVLAASAHLDRAAEIGWCPPELAASGLDPDPCTLRCAVILPRYARLSPRDLAGMRAATDRVAELQAARRRLDRARRNGVPDDVLAGPVACLAYLDRDPALALATLARAPSDRLASGLSPRLRAVRRDNARLFRLQRFLLEEPTPLHSDDWRESLAAYQRSEGIDPSPSSAAISDWLAPRRRPAITPLPFDRPGPAPCDGAVYRVVAADTVVDFVGACATVALPIVHTAHADVAPRFTLTPAALTTDARDLSRWVAACEVAAPGIGDDGVAMMRARCPDDDARWVLYVRDHDVEQAIRVAH